MEKMTYDTRVRSADRMIKAIMPNHPYHNHKHAHDVFYSASRLAKMEGLGIEDRLILMLGALNHDIIFVQGAKDNEEKSAEFARKYLATLGCTPYVTETAAKIILPTKMPTTPNTLLEKILCDADSDNLGRKDFLERGEEVRRELGITDEKKWYQMQYKLLSNHKYYTASAQKLRGAGLEENKRIVEAKLRALEGGA
jgi:uncharacterized protein